MKRATFGERHEGTHITLGRLGGLCRMAGRLEVGSCKKRQTWNYYCEGGGETDKVKGQENWADHCMKLLSPAGATPFRETELGATGLQQR